MYGDSMPGSMSKYLLAWSSSTAGANGRNDSRYLILRFMIDCIAGERASPMIERCPSARGPELHAPLQESDDVAVGDRTGDAFGARRAGEALVGIAARVEPRRDLVALEARSEVRALHLVVHAVGVARVVEDLVPAVERGADGAAGVAGRGLDPDAARTVPRAAARRWRRS